MLNAETGAFTHLPGYPANERLVIIAQGGGRTVLGLWKPGEAALHLRTVPSRDGYHLVPLAGPVGAGAK